MLCTITRADLGRLVSAHPRLTLGIIEALAAQLDESQSRLVLLALGSVPARLAATLLHLAGEGGQDVTGFTHQDLSGLVGANRETVTRSLSEFHAQGLIDPHHRHIRILDAAGLRRRMDA